MLKATRNPGATIAACCLLAISLSLTTPSFAAAQEQDALGQLKTGIAELQSGRAEAGLAEIQKAIDAEPRLAAAHYYAGMASAQLRRWQQAYDYFVAASQRAPGYGEAHMQACRVAYSLGNLDDAFEHAVLAAQAGIDMTDAFAGLEAAMELPEDWRQRIAVPRVFIGAIDIEALLQQGSAAFGGRQAEQSPAGADQGGTTDPLAEFLPGASAGAFPIAVGTAGAVLAAELQAELHEVRRRFGEELTRSPMFGVVVNVDLADWVMLLKVDDVDEGPQVPLKGFVKLLDPESGDEVYSRPLELSNIGSVAELRNDVSRYVGYIEQWLRERQR